MRRRSLLCVAVVTLLVVTTACEPQKAGLPTDGLTKAVAVVPPATSAKPGTWRELAETWVRDRLYPKVLDRVPTTTKVVQWGDTVVRTAPSKAADLFAASSEGRGLAVGYAFQRMLDRQPASTERSAWVTRLASGWSIDQLVASLADTKEFTNDHASNADWVQAVFQRLPGIVKSVSGYSGGKTQNPTYEDICAHGSGHA